jgi:hypothetical protein
MGMFASNPAPTVEVEIIMWYRKNVIDDCNNEGRQ